MFQEGGVWEVGKGGFEEGQRQVEQVSERGDQTLEDMKI